MPVKALSLIVMLAAALWSARDLPLLHELASALRPGAGDAPAAAAGAARVHKCVGPAGVAYTDGPCAAPAREQALDGGALSVLPPAPAPAAGPGTGAAASAVPPLRRLAGPALPDPHERQLEQALQR